MAKSYRRKYAGKKKYSKKKKYLKKSRFGIKRLAKAVRRLQKKERRNHTVMRFSCDHELDMQGPLLSTNISRHNIITANPVFGTLDPATHPYGKKALWKSVRLRCSANVIGPDQPGEPGPATIRATTQVTVAVISPKDQANLTAFNPAVGQISLVEDTDYVRNKMMDDNGIVRPGGHVKMNYARWVVHKMKYLTFGNMGDWPISMYHSQVQDPTHREWTWKIKPREQLVARTDAGEWSTIQWNVDPSKNMFLVTFSSNLDDQQQGSMLVQGLYKYVSLGQ